MRECPHCFRNVIPMADGVCPSCRGNTLAAPEADPNVAAVWIREKSELPEVCCTCGQACDRTIRVTTSRNEKGRDHVSYGSAGAASALVVLFLLLGGCFTWVFVMFTDLLFANSGSTLSVTVPVRQCKTCANYQTIEPQKTDYDQCAMRFVVHKQFAEAMKVGKGKGNGASS